MATTIVPMLASVNTKRDYKTNIKEDSKGQWKVDWAVTPVVAFTANATTGVHASTVFTFTSTTSGTFTGYSWNFGDATSVSTLAAPTHTYATAGTYSVTLTVTGQGGTVSGSRAAYITVT